ncbi:hypothetical protein HID58_026853 [Brassica napus]|uniref:RING-type domain-containing protein n=1 Tax=Brassica napus TaxID=3708 RepID=A0ABQ8CRG7_BRANA|nr:hypothetical protein HID58_026853 [Brassica napus]
MRIPLTQYTGRGQGRGSKAGLSKSFLGLIRGFFIGREDSNLLNQIFDYIVSNFCFKDLNAINRCVPLAPPVTEILDCYRSLESCSLCEKEYPKEGEIVRKTRCNHIFHGTCISRYLLRIPHCPFCTTHLPPVDIRTLLFS